MCETEGSKPTINHTQRSSSMLVLLDDMMGVNPWYPRALPYFLYLLMLVAIWYGGRLAPVSFIPLYVIQCGLVGWLLFRYRKLLPELTLSFHWLAVPTSLGLCAVWVWLGHGMDQLLPNWCSQPEKGGIFLHMGAGSPLFIIAITLQCVGMTLLVPIFEELFMRSAVLRGMSSAKQTGIGVCQLLIDLPLIGDWLIETDFGHWVTAQPPAFSAQLETTPVGKLTFFSVLFSSVIFALGHTPRDWPAAVVCGVTWCVMLWYTNRGHKKRGLGPIIWSHGLTNVLLFAYVLVYSDWQFI